MPELISSLAPTRKQLGAFYTEPDTANAIARLAVTRSDQSILDPSFGGCAFLTAVRSQLAKLGSSTPMRRVFGVDIDPKAVAFLKQIPGARNKQFLTRDFLKVPPEAFGGPVDIILGNPPFVRHHLLSDAAVEQGQAQLVATGKVPRTADSWLYFLHHALRFLSPGGCLAMVLPGALLNAAYAESARKTLATRFASTELFLVRQRLFADALESPVIVVARGYGERARASFLSVVDSPSEIVTASLGRQGTQVDLTEEKGPWRLALLSGHARNVLSALTHRSDVSQFGSLAKIHIGVVTGANRFFVLSESEAQAHRLPDSVLVPILSKARHLRCLDVSRAEVCRLRRADERVLLVAAGASRSKYLAKYVVGSAAQRAQQAFKCRERDTWYRVDDSAAPDAFLSYVIDRGPRMALNPSRALCTNAIHRVWWRGRIARSVAQARAMSVLSSLGSLSAELYGRTCGGGALKLEPSEAAALWMPTAVAPLQGSADAFATTAKHLQGGDFDRARSSADRAVLRGLLGLSSQDVIALRDGADFLHGIRQSVAARDVDEE